MGLRRLQARDALEELLEPVQLVQRRQELQTELGRNLPLLVKLAPDLEDGELDDALDVILRAGYRWRDRCQYHHQPGRRCTRPWRRRAAG